MVQKGYQVSQLKERFFKLIKQMISLFHSVASPDFDLKSVGRCFEYMYLSIKFVVYLIRFVIIDRFSLKT